MTPAEVRAKLVQALRLDTVGPNAGETYAKQELPQALSGAFLSAFSGNEQAGNGSFAVFFTLNRVAIVYNTFGSFRSIFNQFCNRTLWAFSADFEAAMTGIIFRFYRTIFLAIFEISARNLACRPSQLSDNCAVKIAGNQPPFSEKSFLWAELKQALKIKKSLAVNIAHNLPLTVI